MNKLELSNFNIYTYGTKLLEGFSDNNLVLPIKINFYLNKNKNTIIPLAQEIESERIAIVKKYGIEQEDYNYQVPADKLPQANKELQELFSLTQDVTLYKVKLEDFGDINLTQGQMDALMFMIEEDEGE